MMESILRALSMAFAMGWEILWPLILGFALSAVVQAVVSHRQMNRLLPKHPPAFISTALAPGAASVGQKPRCRNKTWINDLFVFLPKPLNCSIQSTTLGLTDS